MSILNPPSRGAGTQSGSATPGSSEPRSVAAAATPVATCVAGRAPVAPVTAHDGRKPARVSARTRANVLTRSSCAERDCEYGGQQDSRDDQHQAEHCKCHEPIVARECFRFVNPSLPVVRSTFGRWLCTS
jgi:hypothetical protein